MHRAVPRRICHINLSPGFRGGERQTELLVRALAARGWPQRLVARAGGKLASRCRDCTGVEVREVRPDPLSAALAGRGCALVHAHEERAAYSGWFLKKTAAIPYVVTRRLHHTGRGSLGRRLAWRAADRLVAVSRSIADSMHEDFGDKPATVVHDAHADLWKESSATKVLDAPGKIFVGHVGELDQNHKGQGTIIAAARSLLESRPELHFVLVGEGRDAAKFRAIAAALDNVEFTGFVDNVQDYLASFDLFVYPSLHEGLGSTLLDAMAFGLPIVATGVGGIPEVVEDGVNGILIPPDRPDALADALVRLLDDRALRESMSAANRARAAEFSAARMTDAYEAIYRSILNPPPPRSLTPRRHDR